MKKAFHHMLTQYEVLPVLDQYLPVFAEKTYAAESSWNELVSNNPINMAGADSRERACHINRRAVQLVCEELEDDDNVIVYPSNQTTYIIVENKVLVRFKKLDANMRPMNQPTKQNDAFWYKNQRPSQLHLSGEFDDWCNVTFGWQTTRLGVINALYLVNEFGNKLHWSIQVNEEGVQESMIAEVPLPFVEEVEESPFTLGISKNARKRQISEQEERDNTAN